jgi:predicted lysophospholipase L1 biosynthesis ABC-type transport system permease subunit
MSQNQSYQKDLESIRNLMERSVKFLSLSGLSGILAGLYALVGAAAAYFMVHYPLSPLNYRQESMRDGGVVIKLLSIAIAVLALFADNGLRTGKSQSKEARRAGLE